MDESVKRHERYTQGYRDGYDDAPATSIDPDYAEGHEAGDRDRRRGLDPAWD